MNAIEPIFEKQFIYDSYSCRTGKGTHAGVARLRRFLRQASQNDSRKVWALKCDISKFFASVEHNKLLDLLSIKITDERTLDLLQEIINSFESSPGLGIPLGNLTSQLFANVYMHQFDFFVKHQLREKYYVRYCDDFVIVNEDRQHLLELLSPIREFLQSELDLDLHPAKVSIRSWNEGIDFLGYVLKPHATLLRTKTKNRMLQKVNRQNLASYLGVCSHADSYETRQVLVSKVW
ncbi:MAG TPA: reverse transcriptase/maturase family protein [Candidatus Saccharimonadales bacterium]|nr:reverse transcriptase/maturase family protein [Candidatus Saccharimonadales bacterium]